jgi:hypothetical protein
MSSNWCTCLPHRLMGSVAHKESQMDIWSCFEHGLLHFSHHPRKDDSSRPTPPFGPSLRANHVILNNSAVTQSYIGWPNFLKGSLSNEWAKLWIKSMGLPMANACERALIQALWDHIYRLWSFRNTEDRKNDNLSIAQYKQQALDIKISQKHTTFPSIYYNKVTLTSLKTSSCYYSYLYILHATAHAILARGSHVQHILHFTSRCPPDISTR